LVIAPLFTIVPATSPVLFIKILSINTLLATAFALVVSLYLLGMAATFITPVVYLPESTAVYSDVEGITVFSA
jgi:hypothetical protein